MKRSKEKTELKTLKCCLRFCFCLLLRTSIPIKSWINGQLVWQKKKAHNGLLFFKNVFDKKEQSANSFWYMRAIKDEKAAGSKVKWPQHQYFKTFFE